MADRVVSASESELLSLCAPRALPGVEHFGGNELYGHDRIIKAYAGLPLDEPLPVLIPHGVCLSTDYVSLGERRAGYTAAFSYPALRDDVYRRRLRMRVVPSASPFLHALQVLPHTEAQREGILFFPAHSVPGVDIAQDWEALAIGLTHLEDRHGPVHVCMYWSDVMAGRHRVFLDHGIPVVSAGHRHDPEFIVRLVDLLRRHRYAGSNSPGSHFFYAVAAGCEFFFLGDHYVPVGSTRQRSLQNAPADPGLREELLSLRLVANTPGHSMADTLRVVSAKCLRSDALMTPDEMRRQVRLCAALDRRGTLFSAGERWRRPVPRTWYRSAKVRASRLLGRRRGQR